MRLPISIKERLFKGRPFFPEKPAGQHRRQSDLTSDECLCDYIDDARSELELAVLTFNELTDEKAIDYASYNLLAARARYSYLLKLAKEREISV